MQNSAELAAYGNWSGYLTRESAVFFAEALQEIVQGRYITVTTDPSFAPGSPMALSVSVDRLAAPERLQGAGPLQLSMQTLPNGRTYTVIQIHPEEGSVRTISTMATDADSVSVAMALGTHRVRVFANVEVRLLRYGANGLFLGEWLFRRLRD